MLNRRQFRPLLGDRLEERLVLSSVAAHVAHPATAHVMATSKPVNFPQAPFVGPVGAMGDSYSDEYRFYSPDRSTARNWIELLNATRGVSFGRYTTTLRGEPRNAGFADNWSRSDATSNDMVANQLPGMTAQVEQGRVKYVSIFIGGNDYLHFIDDIEAGKVAPADIPLDLQSLTFNLVGNVERSVLTLQAANPNIKIVLVTLPDVSIIPAAHAAGSTPQGQLLLGAVRQSIIGFNTAVTQFATVNPNVAILDLAGVTKQIAAGGGAPTQFGGATIDFTNPRDNYHSFFLGDFIHIGTIAQGIIADEFALTVDQKFGAHLVPPTPREIVRYAAAIQKLSSHPMMVKH